jgi:hypothetical protein
VGLSRVIRCIRVSHFVARGGRLSQPQPFEWMLLYFNINYKYLAISYLRCFDWLGCELERVMQRLEA